MASVDIEIANRSYNVACRDGDEPHLRQLAAIVDRKARDAEVALGSMGEARQLLFASLLMADDLKEAGISVTPIPDPELGDALERLAQRVELLADALESKARNA